MKKIVLTFGLISGAILSVFMFSTLPFIEQIGFEYGAVIGYTAMVLAFLFVFFGIRSYRENIGDGYITFGRAFKVGILIMVIATICYVISWQIVYHNFMPNFADKYIAYTLEKMRASGASAETLAAEAARMDTFKVYYQMPIVSISLTFIEPLTVGLPMTLISAAILRRRRKEDLLEPEQLKQSVA